MSAPMNNQNISIVKGKRGGARANAGRKRRMEEHEIIERLSPMADLCFNTLKERIEQGDMKAVAVFLSYYIGLPTQKIESKIEATLNSVSVEVITPHELVKIA
jgi:hypothetical protein